MIHKAVALALIVILSAGGLVGCGESGQKEVVVKGPSEAERKAVQENMTPEQRAAVEAVRNAAQARQSSLSAQGKPQNAASAPGSQ